MGGGGEREDQKNGLEAALALSLGAASNFDVNNKNEILAVEWISVAFKTQGIAPDASPLPGGKLIAWGKLGTYKPITWGRLGRYKPITGRLCMGRVIYTEDGQPSRPCARP